jgi:uncharacterized membrane protein
LFYSFIIYAFLGWVLEVLYHLYEQKRFVNRGFLHGPLCPIYGVMGVSLIVLLTPVSENVLYVFVGGTIIASLLELITGYLLEVSFNTKWWDYSDKKFNFKGYICLRFSIIWGVISIIFMKVINVYISKLTTWLANFNGQILYNIVLISLIVDIALTINSLITFRKLFIDLQEVLAETKNNVDKLAELTLSVETRENIQLRISHLMDIKERLASRMSLRQKSLLRAYPQITSKKFGTAIEEIKKKVNKVNKKNKSKH